MLIEVYELRPGGRGMVRDEACLHCIITARAGKGSFQFFKTGKEELIRELFSRRVETEELNTGGTLAGGGHWDGSLIYFPWTPDAIRIIAKRDLHKHNLCAKIIDEDRDSDPIPPESIEDEDYQAALAAIKLLKEIRQSEKEEKKQ